MASDNEFRTWEPTMNLRMVKLMALRQRSHGSTEQVEVERVIEQEWRSEEGDLEWRPLPVYGRWFNEDAEPQHLVDTAFESSTEVNEDKKGTVQIVLRKETLESLRIALQAVLGGELTRECEQ